jgi:short-subunit dehydrogenase
VKSTALITGASAGLGVEFARQLAARNQNLLLVARRVDKLAEVAAELTREYSVEVSVCAADLGEHDAPEAIAAHADEHGLSIDYLVNNAGSAGPDLLEDRDWSAHASFLELMMISVAHMCHLFIPAMRDRGYGRVINVSSFAARIARAAGGNYGPAKTYVVALSEELALQMRGTGVHVSALCPGFVHTDFHEAGGLMEMKQSLPGFIWYDAETVVREGIEAAERDQAVMVSGRLYRLIDPLAQSVWTRSLLKNNSPGR